MSDALMYEIMPGWLEDNLDEESQSLIEDLGALVTEADGKVAEFESLIEALARNEEEIPSTLLLRGMRDYQRSLIQRMRLNHQVTLAAQGLLFEAVMDIREARS